MTAASQFDGYPYLALWLTEDCCHFTVLPQVDETTLTAWARREHEATGLALQLMLGPERTVLIDAFGECAKATFPGCRFPLHDFIDHRQPGGARPWDDRWNDEAESRAERLAEHCWTRTSDGWLGSLGEKSARRLVTVLAEARSKQLLSGQTQKLATAAAGTRSE